MHRTLIVVFSFFLTLYGFSQQFQITGKVVDNENNPVAFATVVLLKAADSSMVKGASADKNGGFKILNVAKGLYIAKASYVGSISDLRAIDISKDTDLGVLIINNATQQLDEVVVAAKRPTLERKPDRLVFNVENTVVSQGTAWDILKSTPGIIVNQNNISIKNQAATIYLNGRKVQLSSQELQDLLTGLSGTAIKSVEVFTSSSAKYDAEDGSILNIVTNKAVTPGYKGSLNLNYTQAVFPKYNFGVSNYFKTEKLNVFLNYTFNPKNEIRKTKKGVNFINDTDDIFSSWDTRIEELKKTKSHSGSFILDYELNERNSFNLTSNVTVNPNEVTTNISNTRMLNAQMQLDSVLLNDNSLDRDYQNFALDAGFVHKFEKEGSQLSFNAHYTDYHLDLFQGVESIYLNENEVFFRDFSFNTDSEQDINIYTGQVDYSLPISNGTFETGAKYASISAKSSIDYLNFDGSSSTVGEDLSDTFDYDEEVYAVYLSVLKNWENWSLNLGLRGELTDAKGISARQGNINNQNFFELFPSLNVYHSFSDKHSISLDYSRKIDRPTYSDLNPFANFYTEFNVDQGNPFLIPYFSNNFNFNYTINDELFFDVYYRDEGNYINDILVFQDNENLLFRESKQNVLESISYGLDLTFAKTIINPWYLYSYVSLFHEHETFIAEESGGVPYTNEVEGVYAYVGNYFTLSKDGSLTGDISVLYFSSFLFGSYVSSEQINLTAGLKKTLWNNRATISVAAEDILERYIPVYRSQYLNQDNFYRRRPEWQFIRFGFTYNFGNFRLSDNKRNIDKKERDRLKD